jgi:hypothetical protein
VEEGVVFESSVVWVADGVEVVVVFATGVVEVVLESSVVVFDAVD